MEAEGEVYTLTFHVLQLEVNKVAYSLLLERDWLRRAKVSERWFINQLSIKFGPPDNKLVVTFGSQVPVPIETLVEVS